MFKQLLFCVTQLPSGIWFQLIVQIIRFINGLVSNEASHLSGTCSIKTLIYVKYYLIERKLHRFKGEWCCRSPFMSSINGVRNVKYSSILSHIRGLKVVWWSCSDKASWPGTNSIEILSAKFYTTLNLSTLIGYLNFLNQRGSWNNQRSVNLR